MKFIRLEILNLASLDNPDGERVDFEKGALGDATIFSIVGPTGSGKSTILDAICLALYNRAPRYPRKKGERNSGIEIYGRPEAGESNRLAPTDCRNILTRGRRKGYSKLTFLANNGMLYRAEWHVKFNYRNYEKTVTTLYIIAPDGSETEGDWESLPGIIGLDYDQFLRTVLIAQGSFAGFLNAREEERAELLEKLIGAEDKYTGIAEGIRRRKSEANELLRGIRAEHSAYARFDLSEEQLQVLREEIARLEKEERGVREEQQKVRESLAWYKTLVSLREKLEKSGSALAAASEARELMKPEADRLALHDRAAEGLRLYTECGAMRRRASDLEKEIAAAQEALAAEAEKEKEGTETLKNLRGKYDVAEAYSKVMAPRILRARELRKEADTLAGQLADRKKEAQSAEASLAKGREDQKKNAEAARALAARRDLLGKQAEEARRESAEALRKAEAKVTEASASLESLRESLSKLDEDAVSAEKRRLDERVSLLTERLHILSSLEEAQTRLCRNRKEHDTLTRRNAEIAKEVQALPVEALEKELNVLRDTRLLITGSDWEHQRHLLEEGSPCPLCGAEHHPFADEERLRPHVAELDSLVEGKEEDLKRFSGLRDTLREESHRNSGILHHLAKSITDDEALTEQLSFKAREQKPRDGEGLPDNADNCREALEAAMQSAANAARRADECKDLRKKADSALKKLEKLRVQADAIREKGRAALAKIEEEAGECVRLEAAEQGKTEGLEARVRELAAEVESVAGKVKHLESEISLREKAVAEKTGGETPDALEKSIRDMVAACLEALKAGEEALSGIRGRIKELTGRTDTLSGQRTRSLAEAQRLDSALEDWLLNYNFSNSSRLDRETLEALATSGEDREALRLRLKEAEDRVTVSRTLLDESCAGLAAHEELRPEKSEEELTERAAELEAYSTGPLDEARARMRNYAEAREKMGEMYAKMKEAEEAAADWNAISEAIGGDGKTLRKIAQCYTLSFLIEHANREIRRFNTRYELRQVRNSLGIRVIDHERGEDVRDTTSLSGGETFIVSLGLALGLSSLSSRNVSFDNLFIDEGFGSLDPDTLSTVIDSLAMLQSAQGKKVGVISHTDTMSERIPTQIRIIRNGRSGSSRLEIYP